MPLSRKPRSPAKPKSKPRAVSKAGITGAKATKKPKPVRKRDVPPSIETVEMERRSLSRTGRRDIVQLTPSGNERLKLAPLPEDFRSDQLPQILEGRGMPRTLVGEAAKRSKSEERLRKSEGTTPSQMPRALDLEAPAPRGLEALAAEALAVPALPGLAERAVTDPRTAAFTTLSGNLSRVAEPGLYPWSAHVRLFMNAPDGSTRVGSGWIIGKHTIITAGHCVFDGGWMQDIRVRLAVDSNNAAKEMKATFWNTTTQWKSGATQTIREAGDIGVVRVNESLTDSTAPLRYACYSEARLQEIIDQRLAVSVAGFPLDPWNSFLVDAGVMNEKNAEHLLYDVETFQGQSGAPLLFWDRDEQPTVIGVHHWNVTLNRNRCVRINQPTAALLLNWAS